MKSQHQKYFWRCSSTAHGRALRGLQAALGLLVERWFTPKFRKYFSENQSKVLVTVFTVLILILCRVFVLVRSGTACTNRQCLGLIRDPFAKLGTPRLHLSPVRKPLLAVLSRALGEWSSQQATWPSFSQLNLSIKLHVRLEIQQSASNLRKIPWNLGVFFFF